MQATRQLPLTVEQKEALLELGSRGPGARLDSQALCGLVDAGMIEVDDTRRTVLTARGETAYGHIILARSQKTN